MKAYFEKHTLLSYFVLAFLMAWGIGSPIMFLNLSWQEAPLLAVSSAFAPLFAAVIMSAMCGGRVAVNELLGRYLKWRVQPIAYAIAILPFIVGTLVALMYVVMGGERPEPPPYASIWNLLAEIPLIILVGPFSEEAGWRGFALPRLQTKYSATVSSLVLGVIWWLWHTPLWFVGGGRGSIFNFVLFFFHIMSISTILTAIYNLSGGSLLLTVLGHFCANFGSIGFGLIPPDAFYIWSTPVWIVAAIMIIVWLKPNNLAFGKRLKSSPKVH